MEGAQPDAFGPVSADAGQRPEIAISTIRIVALDHETADREAAIAAALAEAGARPLPGDEVLVIEEIGTGAGRPRMVHQFELERQLTQQSRPPADDDPGDVRSRR